jgi:chromosomal replication initiation ATPase DnaA
MPDAHKSEAEVRKIVVGLAARDLVSPLTALCRSRHVTIEQVIRGERTKAVVRAREAVFHHLLSKYGFSYSEVATVLDVDHTTVIAAMKRFRTRK